MAWHCDGYSAPADAKLGIARIQPNLCVFE